MENEVFPRIRIRMEKIFLKIKIEKALKVEVIKI
jgi:hypothetical protein